MNGDGHNLMRLCFSAPSHDRIREGVSRLAAAARRVASATSGTPSSHRPVEVRAQRFGSGGSTGTVIPGSAVSGTTVIAGQGRLGQHQHELTLQAAGHGGHERLRTRRRERGRHDRDRSSPSVI